MAALLNKCPNCFKTVNDPHEMFLHKQTHNYEVPTIVAKKVLKAYRANRVNNNLVRNMGKNPAYVVGSHKSVNEADLTEVGANLGTMGSGDGEVIKGPNLASMRKAGKSGKKIKLKTPNFDQSKSTGSVNNPLGGIVNTIKNTIGNAVSALAFAEEFKTKEEKIAHAKKEQKRYTLWKKQRAEAQREKKLSAKHFGEDLSELVFGNPGK